MAFKPRVLETQLQPDINDDGCDSRLESVIVSYLENSLVSIFKLEGQSDARYRCPQLMLFTPFRFTGRCTGIRHTGGKRVVP